MNRFQSSHEFEKAKRFNFSASQSANMVKTDSGSIQINLKSASIVLVVLILSNCLTYSFLSPFSLLNRSESVNEPLYLLDKASVYVNDAESFEDKVKHVAKRLSVPPEWLMSVMYAESRFDASVSNHRGSGAVGLIQWMPTTAKDFGVTVEQLKTLSHNEQMEYVYKYLQRVRETYGEFDSLTTLYLAILYPKAVGQDYCFTLYAKPSEKYNQNVGLDENKDGTVTISDIDKRMQRIFPTAYMAQI